MNSPQIVQARKKLAEYGKTIDDAATFYLDYLERIRRCNVTVAELAREVVEAKRKDGMSATYIGDLKRCLATFTADFGGPRHTLLPTRIVCGRMSYFRNALESSISAERPLRVSQYYAKRMFTFAKAV